MLHTLTYNATMAPRCKKKSFGVVFGFCTTDSICIIVYYTVVAPELHHSIVRVNPYKIRRSNCKKSDCGVSIPCRSNLFHPKWLKTIQLRKPAPPLRPAKAGSLQPRKTALAFQILRAPDFFFQKGKVSFSGMSCPLVQSGVAVCCLP